MLVTFDGEARSGKGTIVQTTKDFLRDESGLKAMLIDRGQTFRVLVVAATRAGIDLDDWQAVDDFLTNPDNITACTQFVKEVYHMPKDERDTMIYTNQISEASAIIGGHASSQIFVKNLTKKWLDDAGQEGYDVVLVDGRTLEGVASEMHQEGLCDYRLGLYFICEPEVGARRTLGLARTAYQDLTPQDRQKVDELVAQIHERNRRDKERNTERLAAPQNAPTFRLPNMPDEISQGRSMLIIDTSADLNKAEMSNPVAHYVHRVLAN